MTRADREAAAAVLFSDPTFPRALGLLEPGIGDLGDLGASRDAVSSRAAPEATDNRSVPAGRLWRPCPFKASREGLMSMTRRLRRVRPILLVTLAFAALMTTTDSAEAGSGGCPAGNICFWPEPEFEGGIMTSSNLEPGCYPIDPPASSAENNTASDVALYSDSSCTALPPLLTLGTGRAVSSLSAPAESFRVLDTDPSA